MKLLQSIGAILNAWTNSVAAAIIAGFDRMVSPRVVRLIEDDTGGFAVETAGRPENVPARIAFADGALSAPDLAPTDQTRAERTPDSRCAPIFGGSKHIEEFSS